MKNRIHCTTNCGVKQKSNKKNPNGYDRMKNRREEYTSTTNGISCETTSITPNDRQRAKDTKARNEMKSEK